VLLAVRPSAACSVTDSGGSAAPLLRSPRAAPPPWFEIVMPSPVACASVADMLRAVADARRVARPLNLTGAAFSTNLAAPFA